MVSFGHNLVRSKPPMHQGATGLRGEVLPAEWVKGLEPSFPGHDTLYE
jgi:hypothetical protein